MKKVRPVTATKEQEAHREVAQAIAKALVEGKSRQQIVEELVAGGLSEDAARGFIERVMPG
jgi:hypothetical protein